MDLHSAADVILSLSHDNHSAGPSLQPQPLSCNTVITTTELRGGNVVDSNPRVTRISQLLCADETAATEVVETHQTNPFSSNYGCLVSATTATAPQNSVPVKPVVATSISTTCAQIYLEPLTLRSTPSNPEQFYHQKYLNDSSTFPSSGLHKLSASQPTSSTVSPVTPFQTPATTVIPSGSLPAMPSACAVIGRDAGSSATTATNSPAVNVQIMSHAGIDAPLRATNNSRNLDRRKDTEYGRGHSVINHPSRIVEECSVAHAESERSWPSGAQPRKYYTNPSPSAHCHCCARSTTARSVPFVTCSRLSDGLCRKVICVKCFARFSWDWNAASENPSWTCTHCRNSCPERSQCFIYSRVNRRRIAKSRKSRFSSHANAKPDVMHLGTRDVIELSVMAPTPRIVNNLTHYSEIRH